MNLQNPPLAAPISHANRKLTSQRIADMHCAFKDGEKGGLALPKPLEPVSGNAGVVGCVLGIAVPQYCASNWR